MRCFFRGVDRSSYSLDPGLIRQPYLDRNLQELEFNIWQDFKTRGRPYLPANLATGWEEMFLMQHHGFPTRLLDWTESLACAVYFATRDIHERLDGAVWALATPFLIKRAFGDYATHLHAGSPHLAEYSFHEKLIDVSSFNEKSPLPIVPTFLSPRLIAQHGRFTIHTFKQGSLKDLAVEDQAEFGRQCFLHQIIIPGDNKLLMRHQASVIGGACENTLFPDLDGLSRSIKWQFSSNPNDET